MIRLAHPRRRALRLLVCALLLIQLAVPSGLAFGQDGAQVVAGNAAISQDGTTLNVLTQSQQTIINWNNFSIDQGHTANFVQPNAQATVLNRVVTANPSLIYGQLNSNGNVILVNPNGILVGPTGVINTNGFTASVLDIPDHEFLQGGVLNFRGDSTASVINQGIIHTGPGGAALIGGDVINEGTITSYGGSISLATGGSVTLADGSRFTHADLGTIEMGISPYAGVIRNDGTVRATGAIEAGGEVYLVNPGGEIMNNGTISARIAGANGAQRGGTVSVDAGVGGTARIGGEINASGEVGGRVTVEAETIELVGAWIDVAGDQGGGFANIGGGFQGNDLTIYNATTTSVDADSVILADALVLGTGGEVVIWADSSTRFAGTISATGGDLGGDGGLVEVSGANLAFQGIVDTTAANGVTGWLLLDPVGIEIFAGPNDNTFFISSNPVLRITDGTLNAQLSSSNVLLATSPSEAFYGDSSGSLTAFLPNDDNIVIADGTSIDTGSNTLYLSTSTLDLYSTITGNVSGGLGSPITPSFGGLTLKDPTTVNVFQGNSTTGSIDQAIGLVADGGTIGIGAGTFDSFTVNRDNLTIGGVGASSIIATSSPAITIAANGVTVQDMFLQGTGAVDDVGILLDGTAAPNLTGVQVINVDIADMDDGIRSQGDIGDGIAANIDVIIRGDNPLSPAILQDFRNEAIDVGDTDGDAVYLVQDVAIQDGNGDNLSTGENPTVANFNGEGMAFGNVGSVTVNRAVITDAGLDGIGFGALDAADISITNSSITGGRHGILFAGAITDNSTLIDIADNVLIEGSNQGIVFTGNITDATVRIRGNGTDMNNGIRGPSDAIAVNGASLTDVTFIVGGDTAADGNFVVSTQQGVDIDSISGGRFVIANNDLIQGGGRAIEFEQDIGNSAEIVIVNNGDISSGGRGIEFFGNIDDSNVTIAGNTFTNVGNDAVRFFDVFGGSPVINDAVVTIGAAPNVTIDQITVAVGGNIMDGSASGTGIEVVTVVQGDTDFNITDNTIGSLVSPVGGDGIAFLGGIVDTASVLIGGTNQVFATGRAIRVDDLQSPSTLSITGGTYNAIGGSLLVDNTGVAGSDGVLNLGAADFTTAAGGTVIEVLTDAGNAGVNINFGSPNIDGGDTGLRLSGPGIDILGDSLGFAAFTNQAVNYIELDSGAEFLPGGPTVINAFDVTFNGMTGINMTPAQLFATEDRIVHFPDNPTLGLIDISPLFVVQGESIQTAVNFAGTQLGPQTVTVGAGTFGGSVEVWVDNLTLQGLDAQTFIDTDSIDPNANNGDVDNGFHVVALSGLSGGGNVSDATIDGFTFVTDTTDNQNVGIELGGGGFFNQSNAVDTLIRDNAFTDLEVGILADRVDGDTTIRRVLMDDISEEGILFDRLLTGSDSILIRNSEITAVGNAVRFDAPIVNSDITIQGNDLVSTGDNGLQFAQILVDADVLIGGLNSNDGNTIIGDDDAIDVNNILGTSPFSGSSFKVANNQLIQGGDDAIDIDGFVTRSSVGIVGNTELRGGDEGITFGNVVASSLVAIADNRRIFGDGGDAIVFDSPIVGSFVNIGPSVVVVEGTPTFFGANRRIIGEDDGIQTDEIINSAFSVVGQFRIRGRQGSGIEFSDGIFESAVTILGNEEIRGQEEAIEFEEFIEGSLVSISNNDLIRSIQSSAIEFEGPIDNSLIFVGSPIAALGNGQITGAIDGVLFSGAITDASTFISIANNDLIVGGFRGIAFTNGATIEDATVAIRANGIEAGTGDGILFNETVTDATLLIGGLTATGGNNIVAGAEGIDIGTFIDSTAFILNNDIASDGDGIEFDGIIGGDSIVNVVDNSVVAGGDGFQIDLSGSIQGDAIVNLIDNDFVVTGAGSTGILVRNIDSSNPVTIRGGSTDGGAFGIRVLQESAIPLDGQVVVDGVTVNNTTDTALFFQNTHANSTLNVTLQNGVTIAAANRGIVFDGPGLSLTGNTFNDTQLISIAGNFIELRNTALFEPGQPTLLDATGVNFDGLEPTNLLDYIEITNRIIDFLDDPTLGLIFPGAPTLEGFQTYDRFTRYEDYFRTIGSLLEPNAGTINLPAGNIDISEELGVEIQE